MANSPETSAQGSSTTPLQRGKACLNCRRRKMKCDGLRPVCSQCQRAGRDEDCEYADGGRTRTQILQDTIAELEARIEELENPAAHASMSVTLHDPHAPPRRTHPGSSSGEAIALQGAGAVASTSAQAAGQLPYYSQNPEIFPGSATTPGWWEYDEPPRHIAQVLIEIFIPNAPQFGFFLNLRKFLSSTVIVSSLGQENRPLPALMSAVYLVGVYLSSSVSLKEHEPNFLSRLRHQLALVLSSLRPNQVMQAIQAEVLLTYYLFHIGNVVEARYHSSAAVSLAMGYRLHKIRSEDALGQAMMGGEFGFSLPPAQDTIEEGERINGFWQVLVLDKEWAAALGLPSMINGHEESGVAQIDTPWPWDIREYEENLVPIGTLYSRTVQKFMAGNATTPMGGGSTLAMRAQAAILLERASQFSFRQLDAAAHAEYVSLDERIDQLDRVLFPLDAYQMMHPDVRCCLIAHTLVYLATMKLHSRFISENTVALNKCLNAAQEVALSLQKVDVAQLAPINSILGTLCFLTCQEVIRYLAVIPTLPPARRPRNFSRDNLVAILTVITSAMEVFGAECSLTISQVSELRAAYPNTP